MEESIGALLRRSREQRGLSVAQASETTRVRPHYLQALESDDLSAIPSTAQARGFLRIYAEFLGLQIDEMLPAPELQSSTSPQVDAEQADAASVSDTQPTRGGEVRARRRRAPKAGSRPAPKPEPTGNSRRVEPEFPDLDDDHDSQQPHLHPPPSAESPSNTEEKSSDFTPTGSVSPGHPADLTSPAPEAPSPPVAGPRPPAGASDVAADEASEAQDVRAADPSTRRSWISLLLARLHPRKTEQPPNSIPGVESVISSIAEESDESPFPVTPQNGSDLHSQASVETAQPSEEIFAEIGRQLRERREMLSLTQEEIERHTRVKAAFLQWLELGALEELPSPVQTRGILANYAGFLDLDVDTILLRFADGLQARHREHKPQWQPARTRPPVTVHTSLPPLRSFIASDLIFGVGVAVVLLLFAVWGISRVMTIRSSTQARATSPSISDMLAGTPAPSALQEVTLIAAQDTPVPSTAETSAGVELATLDPNVAVQISLSTSERTYMRITVDGKVEFEGRAEPGGNYTYQAARQIEVLVGNAAALRVIYNGRDAGLMGSFGEVVDRIYTVQGVFTPTGTAPPTSTATPKVTATPSLTPSATPSRTATPTSGG